MFIINATTNVMKLTKGDTATIDISIHDLDGNDYEIQSDDVIKLTIKEPYASTVVLTKTATTDHHFIIYPTDTSSLTPKNYIYDVQLTTGDGNIYTIVPENIFQLTGEVST